MRELHQASAKALYACFEAGELQRHARVLCRLVRLSNVDVLGAIRADLFADDWLDFAHASLQDHFRRSRGEVYLAGSRDHQGLVKLGKTGQGAYARLRSLNRENVVHGFELLAAVPVHDRHWVELACHQALVRQGIPRFKEFFPAPLHLLRTCIDDVVRKDRALFEKQGFGLALPDCTP